jgi:membrane-associated phospholipid phosphatase
MPWLDYSGYVAHGLWFGVPFAFGIVLMIYQRERLFEFLMWINVLVYMCAFSFAFLPARPPWMEPGIVRIMAVRNAEYLTLDPNPTAAFPSLHAALPMVVAAFFFFRCKPELRFYAWLVLAYTFVVSFSIVYLGEHWVIDVLGGWAAAGVTAWLCMSPVCHRLYGRIPGDPVGRLSRLNTRICAPGAPSARPEAEPSELPESLPLAA